MALAARDARLAAAEAALAHVAVNPSEAAAAADVLLAPSRPGADEATVVARRARALARLEQGDLRGARRDLRAGERLARRVGLERRAVQAQITGAAVSFLLGEADAAFRALDEAEARAARHRDLRADAVIQRVSLQWRHGNVAQAVKGAERALTAALADDQRADLLLNLGCMRLDLGDLRGAARDLRAAREAYQHLGLTHSEALAVQDLAVVALQQGRLTEALEHLEDARCRLLAAGATAAPVLRATVIALLDANLVPEAVAVAHELEAEVPALGSLDLQADSLLFVARAYLAGGESAAARTAANRAARLWRRVGSTPRMLVAERIAMQARLATGAPDAAFLARLAASADALAAAGLVPLALEAHFDTALVALSLGQLDVAEHHVATLRRHRRPAPALVQARAWRADAELAAARGRSGAAGRAVAAGLRAVDEHRRWLGATELRVQAAAHGAALARRGVALALASGRPAALLCAAERWRAGALSHPPRDRGSQTSELAALRQHHAAIAAAGTNGLDTDAGQRRLARLEREIRQRDWTAAAADRATTSAHPPHLVARLRRALAGRALVEFVQHDGRLHAVVVTDGRTRHVELGPVATVAHELEALNYALRRLGRARANVVERVHGDVAAGLQRLEDRLLAPLAPRLGHRPLVIVPTAALHAVPWSALPTTRGRPVTVAPSATWWCQRAGSEPVPDAIVALVAGPGLACAPGEVAALSQHHPGARVLTGAAATAAATLAALDGATVAHLACHGRFRGDNPMFSCLELADGPVTVYDLETLARVPRLVVLSACDAGLSEAKAGEELLGTLTSLFAAGADTVIASPLPVPDFETTLLMVPFHDALAAGHPPADALALARAGLDLTDPRHLIAATAFSCFGAGWRPVLAPPQPASSVRNLHLYGAIP